MRGQAAVLAVLLAGIVLTGPALWALSAGLPAEAAGFELVALEIVSSRTSRGDSVGGLSGLTFDRERDEWLAVSDDRRQPQWLSLRLDAKRKPVRIAVGPSVHAQPSPGPPEGRHLDFEAVLLLDPETLLISSEGDTVAGQVQSPALLRYRRDGTFVDEIPLPAKFLPSTGAARRQRGLRDNRGFEGIAASQDGQRLWLVAEGPLLQDDAPATFVRGARLRLLELRRSGTRLEPAREFVYLLDPVERPRQFSPDAVVDSGVSELATMEDGTLVAMERTFLRDQRTRRSRNLVRLYALDLADADDVAAVESLQGQPAMRPVTKRLLLDLDVLVPALPPRLRLLENFEALAAGPQLQGSQSVLLLSDDNFNARQVTAALLLRY